MREQYVIVTPAYNEADYIEHTITSVIQQTVRPVQWTIVDDGSTDKTAVIINSYARTCSFIRYLRRRRNPAEAYFASNVGAITEGVRQVTSPPYSTLPSSMRTSFCPRTTTSGFSGNSRQTPPWV